MNKPKKQITKKQNYVLDVSGPCRGPGRVGTGPGDVFTRVLTNFHRKWAEVKGTRLVLFGFVWFDLFCFVF